MYRRGVFDRMQWGVFCTCVFLLSWTSESRVVLKKSPFQCVLSTHRLQRVNVTYKLAKAFSSEGIIKKECFSTWKSLDIFISGKLYLQVVPG